MHCISNWKLNGISSTNISKVTLNAANEHRPLQTDPTPSPPSPTPTPRWVRMWGKIVQWSMKAWSRKSRRDDFPMPIRSESQHRPWDKQHYFISLIGMFWGYTPVKQCLSLHAEFNNSRLLCISSNIIIPIDMRFLRIWNLVVLASKKSDMTER